MIAVISPDLMNLLSLGVGLVGGVLASAVGVRMAEKAKAREKKEADQRLIRHFFEEVAENAQIATDAATIAFEEAKTISDTAPGPVFIVTLDNRRSTLFYDNLPSEFMTHQWLALISRYSQLVDYLNQCVRSRENYRIHNQGSHGVAEIREMDRLLAAAGALVHDKCYEIARAIPVKYEESMPAVVQIMRHLIDQEEAAKQEPPPTDP